MIGSVKHIIVLLGIGIFSFTACSKKSNCPVYWAPPDNQQASDGKKNAGENLNETESGSRTAEFPLVRVKRDKNGVVVKKSMQVKKSNKKRSMKPLTFVSKPEKYTLLR